MRSRTLSSSPPRRPRPLIILAFVGGVLGCQADVPSPMAPDSERALDLATASASALAFRQVAAGRWHTCGLTTDGRAYCWGDNTYGQIGDGTTLDRRTPHAVVGGLRFRELDAGGHPGG